MAFCAINDDQKQSINLSDEARNIIEQDKAAFGSKSISGFFNRVILNYYEDADATLSRTWQRKYEAFYDDFMEAPENDEAQKQFRANLKKLSTEQRQTAAKLLADNAVQKLKEGVIDKYPKGTGKKFRINNELLLHLTESSQCSEDKAYGGHVGRYLKAILEEYARLPYYRREQIYYAQWFADIENAIAAKKRLQITTSRNEEYVVKPYRILTDSQSTYHYLVAWHDDTGRAWPFRISNIRKLKQRKTGSGKITAEEQCCIEEALQKKDVPFMGEDVCTIRVKLTEAGIGKYNTILHMRPCYDSIETGSIYVFTTTIRQAQYYFERFGPDAKILEPKELAQQMQKWHLKAAQQYN